MEHLKERLLQGKTDLLTFLRWVVFSLIIGVVVGGVGILFHYSIEIAGTWRMGHPWLLYLLPLGGLAIVLMYRLCGMEKDRGTNFVLMAVRGNEKLPLKTAPLIFISTVITHLFGGSSGREGAALQLGGSISAQIGRWMRLDDKDARIITMCGMSAAFSALFGTPLTATVFSMEVISVGVMYYSAIVPCLLSSLTGAWLAARFAVAPTQFVMTGVPELSLLPALQTIGLAALCALLSVLFCVVMQLFRVLYQRYIKNPYLIALTGGGLIIALTLLTGTGDYNGTGMQVIARALGGEARPEAFALKMLFTAVTLGASFKGGEIIPVFFCGATFGNVMGGLLGLNPSFGAGLGLAAVFCGVTNCPLTSIILGLELFGADGILYVALAVAVSYMLSGYYSLYSEQKILYSKLRPEFIDKKAE
ncbi:MAG: chloride channel protein [Clostridiales bacterium]|nr:chloride channel protein [Clostridiales bacterium]